MPYTINGNTIITEGDATPASANASFRNFFYRYSLNPATYLGTVGTNYGYITGGTPILPGLPGPISAILVAPIYFGGSPLTRTLERFPFSALINSVAAGTALSSTRAAVASQSSKTAGYSSGGNIQLTPPQTVNSFYTSATSSTTIDSFPFVTLGIISATSVGDLTGSGKFGAVGHQSDIEGFATGGFSSTIEKFPFASFTTSTSVGGTPLGRTGSASQSSPVSGYISGGFFPITINAISPGPVGVGTVLNTISRFPFSVTPVTVSSVSTLTTARGFTVGTSSLVNGYTSGGGPGGVLPTLTSIERFNFSEQTVTNAATPQTLSAARLGAAGISSSEYSFICGGFTNLGYAQAPQPGTVPIPGPGLSTIDIFPFASTTTTAGTISMTVAKGNSGGNQY